MSRRIFIIGASGHGKVVADIAKKKGYDDIVFLDDNPNIKKCADYRVIGNTSLATKYKNECFFVAIGNNNARKRILKDLLSQNINVPYLIHPSAVIDESVRIESGTIVMANVVINANSVIGKGCIINTASSVDHDCRINDFVHVSPGVHIAGTVTIHESCWLGIGSIVVNNIKICKNCVVGAGSVVVKDIDDVGTYIGIPAKIVG